MLSLTVEQGEQTGTVFTMTPGENTLGRSRASTVRLLSSDISGVHARIRIVEGVAHLENLSQFGTRVDGVPVNQPVQLVSGQRIAMGKSTILVFNQTGDARANASHAFDADVTMGEEVAGTVGTVLGQEADTGRCRMKEATATLPARQGAGRSGDPEPDLTRAQSGFGRADNSGPCDDLTIEMQTRVGAPEEIEQLRLVEQRRVRQRMVVGGLAAIAALSLVFVFRPRTPPPEPEIGWTKGANNDWLTVIEPGPNGGLTNVWHGIPDGGYELLFPGEKYLVKKESTPDGMILHGFIGRDKIVPMRLIVQEELDPRLASMDRATCVDDWMQQIGSTNWNFEKPSPTVNFICEGKNGVPYIHVSYSRYDKDNSWFGIASVIRHGCRRITIRAEAPAAERVRAESLLSSKFIRVSDSFQYTFWEPCAEAPKMSEENLLNQARTELNRMAPATWMELESILAGLLTKAVRSGNTNVEVEARALLVKLRKSEALWFNAQQLAFESAVAQGDSRKAAKIAEIAAAVFSSMEDQRFFAVRKWKTEP